MNKQYFETIDYKVKNADKYQTQSRKSKQISKINEQHGSYKVISKQSTLNIQLNFLVPAYVHFIKVKTLGMRKIEMEFYHKSQCLYRYQSKYQKNSFQQSTENSQKLVSRVIVRLFCQEQIPDRLIDFIIFKGKKQEENRKKQQPNNLCNEDCFPKSHKQKTKENEKQSTNDINQDYQKQFQKKPQSTINKLKNQEFPSTIQLDIQQDFNYDIVEYDKIQNVFKQVNSEWIEAQRKAQRKLKVLEEHSLANKIQRKIQR